MGKGRARRHVATLVRATRSAAQLSQSEVADRADLSRPRLSHIESGTAHPTLETALRLGRVVGVRSEEIAVAHLKDALQDVAPADLPALEAHLAGGALWSMSARREGMRVERAHFLGRVDEHGDMAIERELSGCFATRELRVLRFRDRIHGDKPPSFTVTDSPSGLRFDIHVTTEEDWRVTELEFHKPWAPGDEAFTFRFVSVLPGAFVFEAKEEERRRAQQRARRLEEPRGEWRVGIRHCIEELDGSLLLPETYEPEWYAPTAGWDSASVDDSEGDYMNESICASAKFYAKRNEARLSVQRPLLGMKFGIRWRPIANWKGPGKGDGES